MRLNEGGDRFPLQSLTGRGANVCNGDIEWPNQHLFREVQHIWYWKPLSTPQPEYHTEVGEILIQTTSELWFDPSRSEVGETAPHPHVPQKPPPDIQAPDACHFGQGYHSTFECYGNGLRHEKNDGSPTPIV